MGPKLVVGSELVVGPGLVVAPGLVMGPLRSCRVCCISRTRAAWLWGQGWLQGQSRLFGQSCLGRIISDIAACSRGGRRVRFSRFAPT